MSKPMCWKVRISMRGGGLLHMLSKTEPTADIDNNGNLKSLAMEPVTDTEHGDTLGFIDLKEVAAISWRIASYPFDVMVVDGEVIPLKPRKPDIRGLDD